MTKARDTANIVGGGFSGTIAGATMEPTGDTAAGDNAAIGFTAAEGLIITGQGSTGDVTIKNDADALVAHVPTGTTGVNFAGGVIVPDGDLILGSTAVTATGAEINLIDGGTSRGTTAIADGDGVLVNDAGTMRMTNVTTLATYMGTKIGGGMEFLASSGAISDGTASVIFNQFDASKYDYYIFNILAVVPVSDGVQLLMQLSADGTNYDTTNGSYHEQSTDRTGLRISASNVGGASGEIMGVSVAAKLFNVSSSSTNTYITGFGGYQNDSGNFSSMSGTGNYQASTAAHTAVKILFNSGNIESGEITMFGVVNS